MRLESIKERHKQDEIEYGKVSKGLVHEDRGYLLQRLERYEEALKHVRDYERLEENWEVAKVIDEALKEE